VVVGWNAPRKSLELVHPDGLASTSKNKDLHISFDPSPEYGGIAKAAAGDNFSGSEGSLYTAKADSVETLKKVIAHAVQAVNAGRGAVVEAKLDEEEIKEVKHLLKKEEPPEPKTEVLLRIPSF